MKTVPDYQAQEKGIVICIAASIIVALVVGVPMMIWLIK